MRFIAVDVKPFANLLGGYLPCLIGQWESMTRQAFDEIRETRNCRTMAVEVLFRREQRGVKKFYERVEFVSVELHRRRSEEQQSSCQVFHRRKLVYQLI